MNLLSELLTRLLVHAPLGATAILACAAVAVLVMGKRSAALRHRIWTLSMIGTLVYPGLALLLPNFGPQWPAQVTIEADLTPNEGTIEQLTPKENSPRAGIGETRFDGGPPVAEQSLPATTDLNRQAHSTSLHSGDATIRERQLPARFALVVLWLVGLAVSVFAMVKSQRSATALVHRAIPITNRKTLGLAEQLRHAAGVPVAVPILLSSETTVPLTFGCLCPVIVLPSGYGQWTTERCRAVLSHELAHIRRHDLLFQQVAQCASVLYWYHPLVWFAGYRMRLEREFACDDAVLHLGESPQDYARHLLEVASSVWGKPSPPACVVAIASQGGLERRIQAILHPRLNRSPVGAGMGRALVGAAVTTLVVLCLLSPAVSRGVQVEETSVRTDLSELTAVQSQLPEVLLHDSGKVETLVARPAADSADNVVFRFPPDRAIGVIYVQNPGGDIRQASQRWADARGEVRIPIGKKVRLDISAASRQDLSSLRQLPPNSLEMLSIREAKLDEAVCKNISHLVGLKSLRLYCCRIEAGGNHHLAKLSNLELLDLNGSWVGDTLAHLQSLRQLVELDLGYAKTITDREIRHVAKLTSLRSLNLERTRVTDEGLSLLKELVELRTLNLRSTRNVTAAGMPHIARLTSLRDLDLSCYPWDTKQPIGDGGLAHVVKLKELRRLILSGTGLTDTGVGSLQSLENLEELWLPSGPTDIGLKTVGRLTSLRKLGVSSSMASDLGLSHLRNLEDLEFLNLWCDRSRVTDGAAAHLRQLKRLKVLRIHNSAITDDGLRSLAELKSLEDLELHGNAVTFDGLQHLQQFPALRELDFSELKGQNGTLRHLRLLPQLKSLQIGKSPQLGIDGVGPDPTDKGIGYLSGMTGLERLSLSSIRVSDEGIKQVANFRALRTLDVAHSNNSLTDAGLESLAGLNELETLVISGLITDRGLVHLSGLESLRKSVLWGSVSDTAMEELLKSLPSIEKVDNLRRSRS